MRALLTKFSFETTLLNSCIVQIKNIKILSNRWWGVLTATSAIVLLIMRYCASKLCFVTQTIKALIACEDEKRARRRGIEFVTGFQK